LADAPTTEALRNAAEQRASAIASRDPLFAPWAEANIGEPFLVRTVDGRASYWLVPVELGSRTIGFVRVTQDGKAMAAGVLYRDPAQLEAVPRTVTGITSAEALSRIQDTVGPDDVVSDPRYVHDGPPGREAWMIAVRKPEGTERILFVTSSGWYERALDELSEPHSDLEG
jgi:hypothetical protein